MILSSRTELIIEYNYAVILTTSLQQMQPLVFESGEFIFGDMMQQLFREMSQEAEQKGGVVREIVFEIVAELYAAKGGQGSEAEQFTHLNQSAIADFAVSLFRKFHFMQQCRSTGQEAVQFRVCCVIFFR
jgi:hypothetical protein